MLVAFPGVIWTRYGWQWGAILVALLLVAPVVWSLVDRDSFLRLVGRRLVWIYRRHWQPVMIISGLGRHLDGRDCLPWLVKVCQMGSSRLIPDADSAVELAPGT
ncbi:hypothetical protein [Streptosporangium sp. NPDC004631]